MEYIDVVWRHDNPDCPIRYVCELDHQRFELRKLEFFASGEVGYASKYRSALDTRLGPEAVPTPQEINADSEFAGVGIDRASLEELWRRHAQPAS